MRIKFGGLFSYRGLVKYFANTSWLLGEKVLRISVGLVVGIYVARYLGPTKFGTLNYAISFVGLFSALAALGLDSLLVRELVKHPSRRDELLGTSFVLKILGTLFMWIAIACAMLFTSNTHQETIFIAIISFSIVFHAFSVIDSAFQSSVQSKYVAIAKTTQLLVSSLIKIGLVMYSAKLEFFLWVILLEAVALNLGLFISYKKVYGTLFHWKVKNERAIELLKESWPLILSGIVVSIYVKIDQVMINSMLGAKEVGIYAAAGKISEAWYFVPMVVSGSLYPAIIEAKRISLSLYNNRMKYLYSIMIWASIILAVPMSIFSEQLIGAIYGIEYLESAKVLAIHIWAGVFVTMGIVGSKWYLSEGLMIQSFYRTTIGMAINVVLNYFLIASHGIVGAAIAFLVAVVFADFLFDMFGKNTRNNFRLKIGGILFFKKLSMDY